MQPDYNTIKDWLQPLLKAKELSVENFARLVGISRAQVYFYMSDADRPTEENMAHMCRVLGRPLAEGLRQYTTRKQGRPAGQRAQATTKSRSRGRV